jgi:hypothetical protein
MSWRYKIVGRRRQDSQDFSEFMGKKAIDKPS